MSLNPKYITAPSLQSYFVDKDSGAPLSGGRVFFYRDTNRTEPKSVYEIQGNSANYSYSPLPNPIILSAVGTIADNNGNDVIIYYYPEDADGEQDLYYIVVQNSLGVPQFTRPAWPNPGAGGGSNANDVVNYVPNGQFLAHNNFTDNLMLAGSNAIAQGGWFIELDDPALSPASVNTLTFITEPYTQDPPQSPRFTANFVCTSPNNLETTKILRLKFNDVNKFTDQEPFTYAFWMQSTFAVPFSVAVYRDFGTGGSTAVTSAAQVGTATTAGTYFNFEIDFGSNAGFNIGSANDDFIAIDISFPTDIAFNVQFTDAVLSNQTEEAVVSFPVQTNANMLTNSLNGWVTTPDPDGMDLYLPQILTKEGMIWDDSQVGTGGFERFPIDDPKSTSPIYEHNKMPCNGASYRVYDYSSGELALVKSGNGIPFSRLNKYLQHGGIAFGLPLYGTGLDYLTMLCSRTISDPYFRLVYNSAGTGSTLASDGTIPTGWTFTGGVIYNGVTTGTASLNITASNIGTANTLFAFNNALSVTAASAGTSGFTVTDLSNQASYTNFYVSGFYLLAIAASTLVTGGAGKYFLFSNATTNFYMWFQTGTESDPAVGGRTGIQLNIPDTAYTAQDVCDLIVNALNGFQISSIEITGTPPAGSYFNMYANPSSLEHFYVWFKVDGVGSDPNVPSATPLIAEILSGDSATAIRSKLYAAINTFQFRAPYDNGTFFRNADPNAVWDLDAAKRWSYTMGMQGNAPGTYELQNFINHAHANLIYADIGVSEAVISGTAPSAAVETHNTGSSGGTETRPINTTVYPFIRY